MLFSQRKVLYFSIVIALFLSSCMPVVPPNGSGTPIADVTIPASCLTENGQTFIASNQAYCFAYPSGYIVENLDPASLSLTQASVGGVPATTLENASNMNNLLQAMPGGITLLIRYEDRHIDDHLYDLVDKHPNDFYSPWVINGTEAILARTFRENITSYTIHAKRGDFYSSLNTP